MVQNEDVENGKRGNCDEEGEKHQARVGRDADSSKSGGDIENQKSGSVNEEQPSVPDSAKIHPSNDRRVVDDLANGDQGHDLWQDILPTIDHAAFVYTVADVRDAARKGKVSDQILTTPFSLHTMINVIEDNEAMIKELSGQVGGFASDKERKGALRRLKKECVANIDMQGIQLTHAKEIRNGISGDEELNNGVVFIEVDDEDEKESMVHYIAVSHTRKAIVVVFRGSKTFMDWMTDLTCTMQPLDYPSNAKGSKQPEIKVHKGFYKYLLDPKERTASEKPKRKLDNILGTLQDLAAEHPDYKLYSTGHSLGAALSTLFAFCAASAPEDLGIPTPIKCINIGSPCVGDENFRAAFEKLEEKGRIMQLRIYNEFDPIPRVPKRDPVMYGIRMFNATYRYRHVGITLQLYGVQTGWRLARKVLNPAYWYLILSVYARHRRWPCFVLRRLKHHTVFTQLWVDLLSDFHMFLLTFFLCCESYRHGTEYHAATTYRERLLSIEEFLAKMSLEELYQKDEGFAERG